MTQTQSDRTHVQAALTFPVGMVCFAVPAGWAGVYAAAYRAAQVQVTREILENAERIYLRAIAASN